MRNHSTFMVNTVAALVIITGLAATTTAGLPNPGMTIDPANTALVVTDPQNDFLSPKGVTWGVVGKSVEANDTAANAERLFRTAKKKGIPVFVSPRCYYPTDHGWEFEGALEVLMHSIGMRPSDTTPRSEVGHRRPRAMPPFEGIRNKTPAGGP